VSSSGSAVAAAAGLAFGSFGSDTGGSIRFPAHCCGLVGLKPTWGRISCHGVHPLAPSLDHVGPLARRVTDVALLYGAVAGRDPLDAASLALDVPPWDPLHSVARGLRVAFDEDYAVNGVAAPVARALVEAAQRLTEAGATLVAMEVPRLDETVHDWLNLCASEAADAHVATYPARRDDYGPALRALLDYGRDLDGPSLARAQSARQAFRARYDALFADVDLILSPTFYGLTPSREDAARMMRGEGLRRFVAFTAPANLYGCPTLSLPAGRDDAGVPYGFQLVARKGGENLLFDAGLAYERESEWAGLPAPTCPETDGWA
jgi:amidase